MGSWENLRFIATRSQAQVTGGLLAGIWSRMEAFFLDQALNLWGLTLLSSSVITELNYRIPSWCHRALLGRGKSTHNWCQKYCKYDSSVRVNQTTKILFPPKRGQKRMRVFNYYKNKMNSERQTRDNFNRREIY